MVSSVKNFVRNIKNAYNTVTDKKFITDVIKLTQMVVTKAIVEESTRMCERARCQGEVTEENKCKSCLFYSEGKCKFDIFPGSKCPAGKGRYYVDVKLLGTKEEYTKMQRTSEERIFAEEVWDWTEKTIKSGRGKLYVAYSLKLLEEANGNSVKWKAVMGDTVRFLGPDSYQLGCERGKTNMIFGLWERLMKYQFDLRFPRDDRRRRVC